MLIGLFHYDPATDAFVGAIRTPALHLRDVRFERNNEPCRDLPADYHVRVSTSLGPVWCGSAWSTDVGGRPYLCVELDDPTFPEPIQAFLTLPDANGCSYLTWGREKLLPFLWRPLNSDNPSHLTWRNLCRWFVGWWDRRIA